jgi:hypothetical protein
MHAPAAVHIEALDSRRWPLERVLFALAGSMTLISAAAAALLSPWFLLLTTLVGINQLLFVATGACPASLLLQRTFAVPSVIYPHGRPRRCSGGPRP